MSVLFMFLFVQLKFFIPEDRNEARNEDMATCASSCRYVRSLVFDPILSGTDTAFVGGESPRSISVDQQGFEEVHH